MMLNNYNQPDRQPFKLNFTPEQQAVIDATAKEVAEQPPMTTEEIVAQVKRFARHRFEQRLLRRAMEHLSQNVLQHRSVNPC